MDNRRLKLSQQDDEIYTQFRADFPDLDVKVVSETILKTDEAKAVSSKCVLRFVIGYNV